MHPHESAKSRFSIAWKKRACFSTVWKIFFHSVEKSQKSFPYYGKLNSSCGVFDSGHLHNCLACGSQCSSYLIGNNFLLVISIYPIERSKNGHNKS